MDVLGLGDSVSSVATGIETFLPPHSPAPACSAGITPLSAKALELTRMPVKALPPAPVPPDMPVQPAMRPARARAATGVARE
jgi:hypothetical protein